MKPLFTYSFTCSKLARWTRNRLICSRTVTGSVYLSIQETQTECGFIRLNSHSKGKNEYPVAPLILCFITILNTSALANSLEIVNDNSKLRLVSDRLNIIVKGNNNSITIRGEVRKITVLGQNNVIDMSAVKRLVCTGSQNVFLIPDIPGIVLNSGDGNHFHYRHYSPLEPDA